jgi:hypothetical protein
MQFTVFKSKIAFYSLLTRYLCCVLKAHERERERERESNPNILRDASPFRDDKML